MDTKTSLRSVLVALYDLASANRPATVDRIAGRLGLGSDVVRRALARLEADGFADAQRVRLTMLGLAIGVRLAAQRDQRVSIAA